MRCSGGSEATNGAKKPTDVGMFGQIRDDFVDVILSKFILIFVKKKKDIKMYT